MSAIFGLTKRLPAKPKSNPELESKCHSKIDTIIWIISSICMSMLIQACSSDRQNIHTASLSSIHSTSLLIQNNKLLIAGTAKALTKQSQSFYKTHTTALKPQLNLISNDEFLLSSFKAESLSSQTEMSEIHFLDNNLYSNNILSYGNRTRIQDLIVDQTESIITLNYERTTQYCTWVSLSGWA